MKLIEDERDCIGKTVKVIQWGDSGEQVVIAFDDETFLSLRSSRLGDDTEIEMQTHFDPLSWQFPGLVAAFGEQEARSMHNAEVERREAIRRRAREEERARLKARRMRKRET